MREYLLVFLVAGTVTYLLTVIAREIALRTGAVAAVRDRDVHTEPIPYMGGLAMLGGPGAAYLVARELPFLSRSDPFVFRDAGVVLLAGAPGLCRRRPRRHLRHRCADQARRPCWPPHCSWSSGCGSTTSRASTAAASSSRIPRRGPC
ncbi:hypothetical protein LP418_19375 [Nocardioides sp. B-3]|nr:hypothetical protein [Nocardioides sp. B-3]UUZ58349.1 hypothetical protein LP418_19375 [Nocardioides sp. B-3]